MPTIWFFEPDTEPKIGSTEPVSRYVLTLPTTMQAGSLLTDDPTISLKNLLHVYLVDLESVEVSDEDARVDRVRVLGARLVSDLAEIHRGSS